MRPSGPSMTISGIVIPVQTRSSVSDTGGLAAPALTTRGAIAGAVIYRVTRQLYALPAPARHRAAAPVRRGSPTIYSDRDAVHLRDEIDATLARDPQPGRAWKWCSAIRVSRRCSIMGGELSLAAWLAYSPGRFVSHLGRVMTGIEIHPGASIGRAACPSITGWAVIEESTEIGDDCTLYDGVTSAARVEKDQQSQKRHPSIGNDVIIGAGRRCSARSWSAMVRGTAPPRWCSRRSRPARPRGRESGPPGRRRTIPGEDARSSSPTASIPTSRPGRAGFGRLLEEVTNLRARVEQLERTKEEVSGSDGTPALRLVAGSVGAERST